MKEILNIAIQIVFLLAGFGLAFWLLYFALKSPKKDQGTDFNLHDLESKGKFTG